MIAEENQNNASTISELLLQFLKPVQRSTEDSGSKNPSETLNQNISYPELTVRIINVEPLQITDDNVNYIDCLQLQKLLLENNVQIQEDLAIVLKNWRIVFKKVPGNDDFYFDLEVSDFEIDGVKDEEMNGGLLKNILDNREIKYFFEVRKRSILAKFYGIGKLFKSKIDEKLNMKLEVEGKNSKTNTPTSNLLGIGDLVDSLMPEEDLDYGEKEMAYEKSHAIFSNMVEEDDDKFLGKRGIDKICFDEDDCEYRINESNTTKKFLKYKDFKFSHQTVDFLQNNQDLILSSGKKDQQ